MRESVKGRKVAFVIGNLNSGGAERAAINMVEASSRSDCFIVAERSGGDLSTAAATVRVVYASDSRRRVGRSRRIGRLVATLHRERPDVVVSMLSPFVTLGASKSLGLPVIHWLQAPWTRTTSIDSDGLKGRAQRHVLRIILRNCNVIAAATPGLLDECAALGASRAQLAVLPNGLRIPLVGPHPADPPGARTPTIVTVGRLEPQKRHDLTLRAFARIVEDQPARLVVVGSGRLEGELRRLAHDLGITERVQFTGYVESPYDYLMRADVFVLATDHEGFGNAIVEALACGLPVVVSDVPYGPRFILDDGAYGTLVRPNSVPALEAALRSALERSPLDEASAARVQARADSFEVTKVAARFEELVDVVLSGKAALPEQYQAWV